MLIGISDYGISEIIFNRNYPIYLLVYLLIPILVLYKVKLYAVNNNFLSKSNTDILRGLFILIIIFHHISLRMTFPGLMSPFRHFGYLGVSVFFFLSGYGLSISRLRNNDSNHDFFIKRISRVLVPYMLINFITLNIEYFFYDKYYGFADLIFYTLGIKMLNSTMWYINATILLYIVFYLSFRYFNGKASIVILFVFSAVYWLAHAYYFHLGVWWYNTIFCFPIGVYIGNNYQIFVGRISTFEQKNYLILMFGTTGLFLLSYLIANTPLGSMLRMGIVYQTASSILFLLFIMSILLKIQLTSNMMGLLGGISYEMYLVHVQVLNIYFKTYNGNNIYTYFVLVIATSILLKEVVKLIQNLFWQRSVKWRYGN